MQSKELLKHLDAITEHYRVVTSNVQMFEFLKSSGKNVVKLNYIIPEEGPKWEEVVKITREIHKKYQIALKDVKFSDMILFEGYEYQIFMQLAFLIRIRKVLEEKTSTVFILDTRFSTVYFSILRFAETLGYSTQMKIGLITDSRIEYQEERFEQDISDYRKKMFIAKQRQILKHSFGSGLSFNKIKTYCEFISKIFGYITRSISYKLQGSLRINIIEKILNQVDKKILENSPYEATCCFFVSAIREDLYIRPLYPLMDKLQIEKHHFHIITSDVSTELVLSKTNRPFVSIFNEFNIIYQYIRNNEIGINIVNQITKIAELEPSLFAFKEFTSELIDKSFRTISVMIICEHVLPKMHPKSVIIAPTGEIFENTVIEIAKKISVESYSIPPGMVDSNPFYSKWFKADKIFVPGLQAKEVLIHLGYDEKRILVTGNPKYDYIKNLNSLKSKIKLEQTLKIDSKKKLVVIGMSRWHDGDESWMSDLIHFCNKNGFEIIIKVHPLYKIESEYSQNKIKIISQNCKGLRFFIVQEIDLPTLLSAADILITDYSSIGIEAILHDKPLLSVNFSKEKWDDYPSRIEKFGASIYIEDNNVLESKLIEILKEEKHVEQLKEGRKVVVMNYNFGNDGRATDRIYEFVKNPNYI